MALRGEYDTIAAAGTTQADATPMPAYTVMVSSGTGGVMLPPLNRNEEAIVCNGIGIVDLSVYPISGGKLNNATANLPLVIPANRAVRFRAIDGAGNCMAFF